MFPLATSEDKRKLADLFTSRVFTQLAELPPRAAYITSLSRVGPLAGNYVRIETIELIEYVTRMR